VDLERIDIEKLRQELGPAVRDTIREYTSGPSNNVRAFADDIAKDLIETRLIALVDPELSKKLNRQLEDQLLVLAEINNVEIRRAHRKAVARLVGNLLKAAMAGLAAVL